MSKSRILDNFRELSRILDNIDILDSIDSIEGIESIDALLFQFGQGG